MTSEVPDGLPEDLHVDTDAVDLMERLEAICRASSLPPTSIIGALEGVKHSYLRSLFDEDE